MVVIIHDYDNTNVAFIQYVNLSTVCTTEGHAEDVGQI